MPEFPSVSKAEWLAKVEKDLKGKPLTSLEFSVAGATFSPLHHPEDQHAPPPVRGPRSEPCRSGVALEIIDPEADNKVILDLLNKGANALFLHSGQINLNANLEVILKDVLLQFIHVYLLQTGDEKGQPIQSLQGTLFEVSSTPYAEAESTERLARMLNSCANAFAGDQSILPEFWAEVNDDYLTSIAELRALRLCYRLVADAYGVVTPCHIIADPFTKQADKYGGMISTSANITAAIVGGADTVFIPSGDTDDPQEKKFLRRVALNSYNVLDHEAYLNRVADPAAGSYYLETLTDTIAQQVWQRFQQLNAQ